mmetsp:Transcript_84534/g.225801  ORF Transcript_84534/g.225801 Transcript_84534/m.225801 type:complete len:84 (+) Transcript_84534:55-306(+)
MLRGMLRRRREHGVTALKLVGCSVLGAARRGAVGSGGLPPTADAGLGTYKETTQLTSCRAPKLNDSGMPAHRLPTRRQLIKLS